MKILVTGKLTLELIRDAYFWTSRSLSGTVHSASLPAVWCVTEQTTYTLSITSRSSAQAARKPREPYLSKYPKDDHSLRPCT